MDLVNLNVEEHTPRRSVLNSMAPTAGMLTIGFVSKTAAPFVTGPTVLPRCALLPSASRTRQRASILLWQRREVSMKFTRITVDPQQMGGLPCIRGLRIPVSRVVDMAADGMTVAEIIEELPDLEPEDIREALHYAAAAPRSERPSK